MSFVFLAIIFIAHFVGDFVMQTEWEATTKSKDVMALASHVGGYSISLMVAFFLMLWFGLVLYPAQDLSMLLFIWLVFNVIAHFAVDFYTSKLNSRLWVSGNMHNFFLGVGFDQMVHSLILTGSLYIVFIGV